MAGFRDVRTTSRRALRGGLGVVGLVLASLLVSLALAEGVLRVREWRLRTPAPGGSVRSARAEPAPELPELRTVRELKVPHQLGRYKGHVFRTNRYGLRGPEPVVPKPEGRFRILVLGDSVTMGEGVRAEDAYPAVLERALRTDTERFEVINLGLSGLNLRQALKQRLPIGARLEPDLVVYGFTINDLEGLPGYRATRRASTPATPLRLERLLRSAWARFAEARALPGSYTSELLVNYHPDAQAWHELERDLERLAYFGRARGICVAVLLHTYLAQLEGPHPLERFYGQVEEAAARRGLHVIPSLPRFRGEDVARLVVSPSDSHPNPEAHRLLAQALLEGLRTLPKRCWPGAPPAVATQRDAAWGAASWHPGTTLVVSASASRT